MTLYRKTLCLALLLTATVTLAQPAYRIDTIADGLEHPWSLAFLPDGRMLVTERPGRLRVIADGELLPEPVAGVPAVYAANQGGLFEVLPDPDFADNRWLYFSFAHGTAQANNTRLVRARLVDHALENLEVLFTAQPLKNTPVHYGGRMLWLPDGTLLLGLGDGFDFREQAQNLRNHIGTLVRLNPDGSPATDNPFSDRDDALPEIYSFGHRNVQGLVHDPDHEVLWQHEHGPRGGDELNRILPGANYGWPVVTHGVDYSGARISPYTELPGMEPPVLVWTPALAPAGMTQYRGEHFPDWQGDLFIAGLAGRRVERIVLDGTTVLGRERLFEELGERIRDVRSGPDGALYLLTDSTRGQLLRVLPANAR